MIGSVIDTVIYTGILRTVSVECHDDDTPLTFYDTSLFSLLILLVHVSKFNVNDTPTKIRLRNLWMVGIHAHALGGDTTRVASGVDLFISLNEGQINNLDELDESKPNLTRLVLVYMRFPR